MGHPLLQGQKDLGRWRLGTRVFSLRLLGPGTHVAFRPSGHKTQRVKRDLGDPTASHRKLSEPSGNPVGGKGSLDTLQSLEQSAQQSRDFALGMQTALLPLGRKVETEALTGWTLSGGKGALGARGPRAPRWATRREAVSPSPFHRQRPVVTRGNGASLSLGPSGGASTWFRFCF